MVAIVGIGAAVRGAVEYNEKKVKEGKASILFAENYHKDAEELTFRERVRVLENRAALHPSAEQKCLHICLSLDPSEKFDDEKMAAITRSYMDKLGYGKQPYLAYRHSDTGVQHLHIVTTSIEADGQQKNLRYIGRDLSNPARKYVEKEFGLVPAESKSLREFRTLTPVDSKKALYGKSETKAVISNIVRSVFNQYTFSSLPEFNAILEQFNVIALRGEPGSELYKNKGLVYSIIDPNGKRIGKPIKASSIYERPTLVNLEKKFLKNKVAKTIDQKGRVSRIVSALLKEGMDKETFLDRLSGHNIHLKFFTNSEGRITGATFVDNLLKVVFKGSDLNENYSASSLLAKLKNDPANPAWISNKQASKSALEASDFPKGLRENVKLWARRGMIISARPVSNGTYSYYMGSVHTSNENHWLLPTRMQNYFRANNYKEEHTIFLKDHLLQTILKNIESESMRAAVENINSIVDNCFDSLPLSKSISKELLMEARRKKRRRPG